MTDAIRWDIFESDSAKRVSETLDKNIKTDKAQIQTLMNKYDYPFLWWQLQCCAYTLWMVDVASKLKLYLIISWLVWL